MTTTRHHALGLYLDHPSRPAIAPKGATTAITDHATNTVTVRGNGRVLYIVPANAGYQIKRTKG